jgi:excisionase family DNA binding protein
MKLRARLCPTLDTKNPPQVGPECAPSHVRLDPGTDIRVNPPAIMTIGEAAAYLALSRRTVEGLIASRRLRVSRIGRRVLIRREWVDELVD